MSPETFHPPATVRSAPPATGDEAIRHVCTFLLDGKRFGVDILDVQEVAPVPSFTPVHHAPPQVAGVVNIRGEVVLCLDLRRLLDLPPVELTRQSKLVLFKRGVGEAFGALVDRIGDIAEIPEDAIEECCPDPGGKEGEGAEPLSASAVIRGVCKLKQELILMLDAARLLPELDTAFRAAEERHAAEADGETSDGKETHP